MIKNTPHDTIRHISTDSVTIATVCHLSSVAMETTYKMLLYFGNTLYFDLNKDTISNLKNIKLISKSVVFFL